VPDQPHVQLRNGYNAFEDLYGLRSSYFDPASDAVRRDGGRVMRAGGYSIEEAWERALRYAVAGLDIAHPLGDVSMPLPQEAITDRVDADVVMASVK
jgi:CDK-activating kinase assembly factor MAT1